MLREIYINEDGDPEMIELPDPIRDGWKGFWVAVREWVEMADQIWCSPHLLYIKGEGKQADEKPLCRIEKADIFPPGILIGVVWNDQDQPEPVSLTDRQAGKIYEALEKENPIQTREEEKSC